jgi:UPF0716 protein FxsA
MLPLLLLLFIVVPIVELYVIIQVGQAIGVLWTLALLVADSIIGSLLMRSQGRLAWRRFNAALAERRPPAREVADGALIIFGGAFLLAPGFITDVFGLLFLLPPTRALIRRFLLRSFTGHVVGRAFGPGARRAYRTGTGRRPGRDGGGRQQRPPAGYDVEGTATEVDPRHLQ